MLYHRTDKEFYIWMAGFVDGEGCLSVTHLLDRERFGLRLRVGNTCQWVLSYICKRTFGNVRRTHRPKHEKSHYNSAKAYSITWTGYKALKILKKIYPYLTIKKEHVRIALQYPMSHPGRKRSRLVINKIKSIGNQLTRLNKKGKERIWYVEPSL